MSIASHLENLNGAQRKAAAHGEPTTPKGIKAGPLAIVAGAGTGKTETLAHRIGHLAIHGVDPARILLLMPTRRAAGEVRRRAHDVVKKALNEPLGGVSHTISQRLTWAGTFHSIGNRLLRHYGRHLKLDPQFTVVDRADAADLLEVVRAELGLVGREQRFPRKETCLQIYSHRVNTRMSLPDTLARQFPWCAQWEADLTRMFRTYVERKQRCNVLDHDDLLLYWHAMMAEQRLAHHVGAHFDHVLVDEYQDANRLQVEILHALKPDGAGVVVAGDDTLATNPFRAGSGENILGFADRFKPAAEVIALAQNCRATQQVLDAANALLAEAPRQQRKHLLSMRGQGVRPTVIGTGDCQSQVECVCAEVTKRREANLPLRGQAVLFRAVSHAEALEAELIRRKIPYSRLGGLGLLEAAHVKDLIAVLRWADNPRNTMAALRVMQLLPGMGVANARKAIEHFEAHQHDLRALQSFVPPQALGVQWRKLTDLMLALGDAARQWPGQVNAVREWYRPHFERIYEHFHTRIGDLDRVELHSGQYPSRERFLTELTLDPPEAAGAGAGPTEDDCLVLASINAAKGREWDVVYLLNAVEGVFPSEFAAGRPEVLEEERRLLYVAMTRARNELLLLAPARFALPNQIRAGDTCAVGGRSRFLSEKVQKFFDSRAYEGSGLVGGALQDGAQSSLDVGARLKEMW
jgi:DNA helicase-2/ATP-dependent DNA helicase PcrA